MNTHTRTVVLPGAIGVAILAANTAMADSWGLTAPGIATAVASGWVIGADPHGDGNFGIYQLDSSWSARPGGAKGNITVDQSHNPWVINANHQIFRWNGASFVFFDGSKSWLTVAVGNPNNPFEIVATDTSGNVWIDNNGMSFGAFWTQIPGIATKVAVFLEMEPCGGSDGGPTGIHIPWVINSSGSIFKYIVGASSSCSSGSLNARSGFAKDITTDYVLGGDNGLYQSDTSNDSFDIRAIPGRAGLIGIGSDGTALNTYSFDNQVIYKVVPSRAAA
jgi:hypothetical protein